MTRSVMTFGDSNTHGTIPMEDHDSQGRFDAQTRWPGVMAQTLGPDWTLIEEGLPGRIAACGDTIMGDQMDGRTGLKIALASHRPIDMLTIMLGTNDVKHRLGLNARQITAGIAALLDIALDPNLQAEHDGFAILLICPPPIIELPVFGAQMLGGATLSRQLAERYKALAEAAGTGFLDAGTVIEVSSVDGLHFDEDAHVALGQAVARSIAAMS